MHLFQGLGGLSLSAWFGYASKVNAMTEYQKIALGLLGMTHPEIYRSVRVSKLDEEPSALDRQPHDPRSKGAVVSALKFAFAALVAGSRAVPLGDNGEITRELGAYGAHLRFDA
jgi:hypothetical protein